MKKNRQTTIVLCGLIAMIVTLLLYFLIFDSVFSLPIRWISLMFVLAAEVMGIAKSLKNNKSIFGVTTITVSAIHLIIVVILALVFVNFFPVLLKQYVLFNLLILAIAIALDILLLYLDGETEERD